MNCVREWMTRWKLFKKYKHVDESSFIHQKPTLVIDTQLTEYAALINTYQVRIKFSFIILNTNQYL